MLTPKGWGGTPFVSILRISATKHSVKSPSKNVVFHREFGHTPPHFDPNAHCLGISSQLRFSFSKTRFEAVLPIPLLGAFPIR